MAYNGSVLSPLHVQMQEVLEGEQRQKLLAAYVEELKEDANIGLKI